MIDPLLCLLEAILQSILCITVSGRFSLGLNPCMYKRIYDSVYCFAYASDFSCKTCASFFFHRSILTCAPPQSNTPLAFRTLAAPVLPETTLSSPTILYQMNHAFLSTSTSTGASKHEPLFCRISLIPLIPHPQCFSEGHVTPLNTPFPTFCLHASPSLLLLDIMSKGGWNPTMLLSEKLIGVCVCNNTQLNAHKAYTHTRSQNMTKLLRRGWTPAIVFTFSSLTE